MTNFHRLLRASLLLVLAALSGGALAGPLADSPLFLGQQADANVLFNLSVEWPTAETAAYTDTTDTPGCPGQTTERSGGTTYNLGICYAAANTYRGYFNPNRCYTYDSANDWFVPQDATDASHNCAGQWSGNLLNWSTMTAIDVFRGLLSGGNRDVDTTTSTVLLRAMKYRGPDDYVFRIKRLGGGTFTVGGTTFTAVAPSSVTPFDQDRLYLGNTGTELRVYTGLSDLSRYTSYRVRVQVCASGKLEDNCIAYPGTASAGGARTAVNKPVGLIQNNAGRMRFAATAYLNDSDQKRNGGVLRARMKYAGPTAYVPGTGTVANARAEWDASTGIFGANPDPADATTSGVASSGLINYLNKFGYASNYKTYDTLGEMYYEALRYYKNLGPTQEYSTGLTSAMKDGFPVITNWDDPILMSCQKNFIVSIGDANTWCDSRLPGTSVTSGGCGGHNGAPSGADPAIDVTALTNRIGNLEGLGNIGNGVYAGNGGRLDTWYMAGLAYYANTQDIRPDDPGQPQTLGKQTVQSFMIDVKEPGSWGGKNQYWMGAKYGGFSDVNNDGVPANAAAWSSDGGVTPRNYAAANRPDLLAAGLTSVFSSIASQTGSAAAMSASGGMVNTGSHTYQSEFTTQDWSGHLKSYTVTTTPALTLDWDAADVLTAQLTAAGGVSGRVVYTYNPSASDGAVGGRPFTWSGITATQQGLLGRDVRGAADGNGQARLNWIRGDAANEGASGLGFRARANRLGDIVDASPAYVSRPQSGYNDSSYISWAAAAARTNRTAMVYVGANDGMLHGFAASNGQEKLAYVPNEVFGRLNLLPSASYAHKFYVDGSPTVTDAQVGGEWRTVLVGGLRGGGQGIYALNVTDPSAFTAGNAANIVMWEFTDANDPDLGYTFSQPQVVKTNARDGNNNHRWAVVVGNGSNNTDADGSASSTGAGAVFVIFLDGGSGGQWREGTDYIKLVVGGGGSASPNGVATPALTDENGDGTADVIYASDLNGNVWKFDISSATPSTWKSALDSTTGPASTPLWTATDASGNRQAITTSVEVSVHPLGGNLVFIGTGKLTEVGDLYSTGTQSLYAIWDKGSGAVPAGRSRLQAQTVIGEQTGADGNAYRITSANAVDWTTRWGWYLDLPNSSSTGERIIYAPVAHATRIVFTTMLPSTAACSGGGSSWLMEVDALTGSRVSTSPFDVSGDQRFSSADLFGANADGSGSRVAASGVKVGVGVAPPPIFLSMPQGACGSMDCDAVLTTGSNGNITPTLQSNPLRHGRLSWREISR